MKAPTPISFSFRPLNLLVLSAALVSCAFSQSIPFDADVSTVAVDPRNPSRIYASTSGGLLKTDNRGATWEQLPIFALGRRQPAFREVEFDLNNTSVIYALAYGSLNDRLVGAWRSSNRGLEWQRIVDSDTFPFGSTLVRILVAPTNGAVLYAVIRIGVSQFTYRSADGGTTWARGAEGAALSVSTGNADTLYRANGTNFLRSTDGGQSWLQLSQVVSASSFTVISGIAASPSDPNLILAGVSGPSAGIGIYRSTNGGGTWRLVQSGGAIVGKFNVRNPSLVVFGDCCGLGGFYSNDAGMSFTSFSSRLEGPESSAVSIAGATFDYSQMGGLIAGVTSARGGGVTIQNGPLGAWRKLAGTYTPTAVAQVELQGGQLLSGDRSTSETVVRIVAGEGSGAARFGIGNPSAVGPGTSARLIANSAQGAATPQSVLVSRTAQDLGAGNYNTTVVVPVTGALNRDLTIEGPMEVVNQPRLGGVSLKVGLPSSFSDSIDSIAVGNGRTYLGSFSRLVALDGSGNFQVIAGTGTSGFSGDGGPAASARVSGVVSIAVGPDGTVYFFDRFNSRIRRITPAGIITTLAGNPSGATSFSDGAQLNAISLPSSTRIAIRQNGELLIAVNSRIWRVDGTSLRLLAGGGSGGVEDGGLANAVSLSFGTSIALDSQNAILFTDRNRLFRIQPNNTLQLLAGAEVNREIPGSRNAREVGLSIGSFVAGPDGVYLFDGLTNTVRRVNPDGSIETVALNGMNGNASECTGALYAPASSSLSVGLAIAADGSLLVTDSTLKRFWIPRSQSAVAGGPVVTPEGVVNAASLKRALSAGTLASIFGLNLAAGQAAASSLPLPAELAGGVACMAGRVAPIAFASPSQLNVQIPFGLAPGTYSLRTFNAAGGTGAVPVNLQPASPEIFRANGRAIVINPDGSLNQADRGVAAGEVVVAYLTGIGEVIPSISAGTASPSNPLALPAGATRATVGGMNATLLYLGMSPGFVGLAQANLRIPMLGPGEHELVLSVGSQNSEPLAITVQ